MLYLYIIILVIIIWIISNNPPPSYAHSGKLDEHGGHYKNGVYHTHIKPSGVTNLEVRRDTIYKAHIDRVVDGDTVIITFLFDNGSVYLPERCRFLGLDTPEKGRVRYISVIPDEDGNYAPDFIEDYGDTAAAFTNRELLNKTVWLQTDAEPKDKYGRVLAYVWLSEPYISDLTDEDAIKEKMFNAHLLSGGHARKLNLAPSNRYASLFETLEYEAKTANLGLWNNQN